LYFFCTLGSTVGSRIDTVSAREKLASRRAPHWHRVSKGCYVGFRRMTREAHGTWLARSLDAASGKQVYKTLGELSEMPAHLRFDAAQRAAGAWFEHLGRGGTIGSPTVRDACERYVAHLQTHRSPRAAHDARARFDGYVLNHTKLAGAELAKLVPAHIDAWRKSLRELPTRSGPRRGEQRSDSSLNRDMSCFRAALNLAVTDGLITSDFAWRSKLRPVKNADRRRELYLDRAQRRRLVEHASADLAQFLRGLSLLPLRPGALAALRVGDFDFRLGVLSIGHDKAGRDRRIKLPRATAAYFAEAASNKLPQAPLLCRGGGQAWNKDAWKWPVKAAVQAAGLPSDTTAYSLRHSVISDLVHDGLDLLTVAQISGTSVVMIERHYGHLRGDIAASALARLAL
jgi:integrase